MPNIIANDNGSATMAYLIVQMAMIITIFVLLVIVLIKVFESRSGFQSNIEAGSITSGADIRFAGTPSQGYPNVASQGFFGANEQPVFWNYGSPSETQKMLSTVQAGYSDGFTDSSALLGTRSSFKDADFKKSAFTDDALSAGL